MLDRKYVCKFCAKNFTRKSWYDKHTCEKKRRFEERHNIATIKAHRLFNHWQSRAGLLKRGRTKTMEEFLNSPIFSTFKKLVDFTLANYVVSGFRYLDWLVEHGVKEVAWFNVSNLSPYQEYLRRNEDPLTQAQTTVANIKEWCQEREKPLKEFFSAVTPINALQMIKMNRLSPWVLFGYEPAVEQLTSRINGELLYHLDEHISVEYWLTKIKQNAEGVAKVNEYMKSALAS